MSFDTVVILYPERLFRPRGEVWDWAERVKNKFVHYSIAEAPMRSGNLKTTIYGNVDSVSKMELGIQVGSTAEYASYVLGGTEPFEIEGTVIMDNSGGMTRQGSGQRSPLSQRGRSVMPTYKFGYNVKGYRNWIDGSPSQNFFAFAYHRTAAVYRSLGSWSGINHFWEY